MNIAEQIEKLASLHAAGVLTDSEYQAAKARVLGNEEPGGQSAGAGNAGRSTVSANRAAGASGGGDASPWATRFMIVLGVVILFGMGVQLTQGDQKAQSTRPATDVIKSFLTAGGPAQRHAQLCASSGVSQADLSQFYTMDGPMADEVSQLTLTGPSNWWPNMQIVEASWTSDGQTMADQFHVGEQTAKDGKGTEACVMWSADRRLSTSIARLFHDGGTMVAYLPVKLASYYEYQYADSQQTHFSLRILHPQNNSLHGLLPKNATGAGEIFTAVEHGGIAMIRCELSYPPFEKRHESVATIANATLVPLPPVTQD